MTEELAAARRRLERIANGATLQQVYCGDNFYEPIGDRLRSDLTLVLKETA